MIGNIFCIDNQDKIEYQRGRLSLAKERIKEFSTIASVFNNFDAYEIMMNKGNDIPSNVVFNLISNSNYNNTYTQRNLVQSAGTYNEIKELEDALNNFFVSSPTSGKEFREFCTRLTSDDNFTSLQAYNEIIIAHDIGKKIGFENVHLHYESSDGKKPDLLLDLDGKRIFLELTALEIRVPEKKINEIASIIANYILKKSTKSSYLISILLDTMIVNRFKDKLGHIVVKNAVSYLKEMIDRLHLVELIGLNGSLNFHDRKIHLYGKKIFFSSPIEAIIHIDPEYDESKSVLESSHLEILDNTRNKQDLKDYQLFESWAQKMPLNNFLNSPFDMVGFSIGGNNGCVYINSLDFDSTDSRLKSSYLISTSEIAKTAFKDHIKRRIDDKVLRAQYEKGSPFVIGIQASQWQFEYEYDYDDFVPVRNEIHDYLKKYPEVSGVILFTYDMYHGKFIENPNASQKVNPEVFESSGILYKHIEPQFTHDRKTDLSSMDYSHKVQRISELLNKEKDLQIKKETYYTKEDLEELLGNINEFLSEKKIEQDVLLSADSVIKRYCKYKTEREDSLERRDDPIYESKILILGNVPLRAYAAACQIRLTWHLPTSDNILLIKLLAEDSNSYVRESVSRELGYFFDIDPGSAIEIAKRYCLDNKFVRWYLRGFLGYLFHKDRKRALELFSIIITEYGKRDLVGQGEDVILRFAVDVVTQVSLLLNEREYLKLFEDMITNTGYNLNVKKQIITTMTKPAFTSDQTTTEKTINYYLRLLRTNSSELKAHIEFFLLYELIQRNISLLPNISPVLDELSNTKYDKPILGFDHTYHFTILDYICKFFGDFPEAATQYFLTVTTNNEFLIASIKVSMIIKILEKIFDSTINLSLKREAKLILGKIDHKLYWQARNLSEKVKDL